MEEKQTNSHGHHWIKIRVFSSSSSTGYMRKPEEKQRGGERKKEKLDGSFRIRRNRFENNKAHRQGVNLY